MARAFTLGPRLLVRYIIAAERSHVLMRPDQIGHAVCSVAYKTIVSRWIMTIPLVRKFRLQKFIKSALQRSHLRIIHMFFKSESDCLIAM
jgi:hypothetical protein